MKFYTMSMSFVPATKLQRNTKAVMTSDEPFQIILNNNEMTGMVINKETSQYLIDSGLLDQIREEMFELNDPATVAVIDKHRAGKSSPVSFDDFTQKNGF